MPKQIETRLLNGGVNADSVPQLLQPNELLNAMNVTVAQPSGQNVNSIHSIFPAESLNSVNAILVADGGTHTLVGKWADERRVNTFYLFYYNTLAKNKIIKVVNGVATVLFREAWSVTGLGWNANSYVSARTYGDILVFTSGGYTMKLNTETNYSSLVLEQGEMSLLQQPSAIPLFCLRFTDSAINTFDVQLGAYQFCVRFQNTDGIYSVLSPLSATIPPMRKSVLETTPNAGNTIAVGLDYNQKIPRNWQSVDFIVRDLSDNTFSIIQTYVNSNAADIAAVNAHNLGLFHLSSIFNGKRLEILDTITASKQFEFIPITSKHIEVGANRILLANNVIGYDTPTTAPTNLAVTPSLTSTVLPSFTATKVYLVLAKNFDVDESEFPIYGGLIVYYDNELYSLPLEYSQMRMNGTDPLFLSSNTTYPYNVPYIVQKSNLVKLDKSVFYAAASVALDPLEYIIRLSTVTNNGFQLEDGAVSYNLALAQIVWQIHEIGNLTANTTPASTPSGNWFASNALGTLGYIGLSEFTIGISEQVLIADDPSEYAAFLQGNAFLPYSVINYGIRYYDEYMRSCGVQELGTIKTGSYTPYTLNQLVNKIDFTLTSFGGSGSPSWAKYFAITLSKQNTCDRFIQFAPNCIKIARTDKDGVVYVTSDLENNLKKDKIYGIAVPLDTLKQYNKGYDFTEGDYMRLSFGGGFDIASPTYTFEEEYTGRVLAVIDGHIIITPPKEGSGLQALMSAQFNAINSPTYALVSGFPTSLSSTRNAIYRQQLCFATIYIQPQSDISQYEVAKFGVVGLSMSGYCPQYFFENYATPTTVGVLGDCYTLPRISSVGGFTGLSDTTNESNSTLRWVLNDGRIAPIDRIGQQELPNEVRYSNVGRPNGNVNGVGNFDANDYKLMDFRAGSINMLQGFIGDSQRNDVLLIICNAKGYYALLNQSLLRQTTNNALVSASDNFLDNINELDGNCGTQSPRSFTVHNGNVIWADALNKQIVMYQQGQVAIISDAFTKRVFKQLLETSVAENNTMKITGSFNPLVNEYLISINILAPTNKPVLPTTILENPLDFYYKKNYTYVYNVDMKKWQAVRTTGREYFHVYNNLYSWDNVAQRVYTEDIGTTNPEFDGMITIPFNDKYPATKAPLALRLDATRAPDEVWIQADTNTRFDLLSGSVGSVQVANVGDWQYREGDWLCYVLRDRMSRNATSSSDWNVSGLNGTRLKGKNLSVVLIWYKTSGHFSATSCSLAYE